MQKHISYDTQGSLPSCRSRRAKSTSRDAYAHSLSYQAIILKNCIHNSHISFLPEYQRSFTAHTLSLSPIQAVASTMELEG
jgi:hypothetical protein